MSRDASPGRLMDYASRDTPTRDGLPGGTAAVHQNRADLACALGWAARLDLHEGVANHFSLALNPEGTRFLLNPNGRHFSRVRAILDDQEPDYRR